MKIELEGYVDKFGYRIRVKPSNKKGPRYYLCEQQLVSTTLDLVRISKDIEKSKVYSSISEAREELYYLEYNLKSTWMKMKVEWRIKYD